MQFDRETRLSWLDPMHDQHSACIEIEERSPEGRAAVKFQAKTPLLSVRTTEGNALSYLKQRKVADGTICQWKEGQFYLHIIELKRTVREKNWLQTKEQFEGALQNAHALCGVIGETAIAQVTLYTGYRHDKVPQSVESANPILNKARVGQRGGGALADWHTEHLMMMGCRVRHIKVQLDDCGDGEVMI